MFMGDISDFLINKAKQKGIPSEKLVVCDATKLKYKENSFDYSFSIGSLEHFTEDQIEKFLISAKKLLNFIHFIKSQCQDLMKMRADNAISKLF